MSFNATPSEPSAAYRLYRAALLRYRAGEASAHGALYRRALETLLHAGATGLAGLRRFRFPARAISGWWWTWRWRFELIMGWLEYDSVRQCRRLVRPGMTVVDAGAHVGYYTRILSHLVGPLGRVFAFEPFGENLALLRRNLAGRRYRNVEVLPLALADGRGRRSLYVSPGSSNHSLVAGYTPAQEVLEVETISLDEFLTQRGIAGVDFIKIDVEGAEPLVLAGMRRAVAEGPPLAMLIECNPVALRAAGCAPAELEQALRGLRLEREAILPCGPVDEIEPSPDELPVNWLCRRRPA